MMKKFYFALFVFVFSSYTCTPKRAPEKFENCISFYKDASFLIIEVKPRNNIEQYSLVIGLVYFVTVNAEDDLVLSPTCWTAKTSDDIFLIKIDLNIVNKLMQEKDFFVRVLLYNEKRGREELYMS